MTRTIFNILAICGAAGFSGVMLSIGVTLGGYWRSLPAQSFLDWFTANNQFVSRAIPLIVLPTIIGLIGSLWTSWNSPDFKLWVLSALCAVVVMILTLAYFVPANTAFANGGLEIGAVSERLNQWILLHYVRIALAMLAAIFGVLGRGTGKTGSINAGIIT